MESALANCSCAPPITEIEVGSAPAGRRAIAAGTELEPPQAIRASGTSMIAMRTFSSIKGLTMIFPARERGQFLASALQDSAGLGALPWGRIYACGRRPPRTPTLRHPRQPGLAALVHRCRGVLRPD